MECPAPQTDAPTDPSPALSESRRHDRLAAWLLLALLVGYVGFVSSSTLWDRDEPRFARAAMEMLGSGDYLVPTLNGNLRPDKPAMIYWLMSIPLRVLGPVAVAARLPSVFGSLATVLLTYLIGKRMFTPALALRAAGMLGTTLLLVYAGTAATADGTLLAWITLAHFVFVDRVYRGAKWWQWPAMALALGGAQLTKGPVGLAVPLLTMGTAWLIGRRSLGLSRGFWLGLIAAALAGFGMFAAWGLPANAATGGQLAQQGLGRHVFERMVSAQEGHGGAGLAGYLATLPVYVPVVIAGFMPWTMHLPGAVSAWIRRHVGDRRDRAVLMGWAVPTFLLMSLVVTKLPHYILPIFPALALGTAAAMEAHRQGKFAAKDVDWLRGGIWFFAPPAGLLVVALGVGPWLVPDVPLGLACLPAALVLGVTTVLACIAQFRERVAAATRRMLVGILLTLVLVCAIALPQAERVMKVSQPLAEAIHAATGGRDVPVYWFGYTEHSVVFYVNRPAGEVIERPRRELNRLVGLEDIDARIDPTEMFTRWAAVPGEAMLITTADKLADAGVTPGQLGLQVIFDRAIFNYSAGGERQRVMVLRRHPQASSGPMHP